MKHLAHDLRYAARTLLKSPGFTLVAVLTLALGIGANTAIFSYINSLFLRPLPVDQPQELVRIYGEGERRFDTLSFPNFTDLQRNVSAFAEAAAHQNVTVSMGTGDMPETARGELVSGTYFPMFRVKPALGRMLTADDDHKEGGHPQVVISDGLWRSRFGAAGDVIGRIIHINGHPFTIIGVAPAWFRGSYEAFPSDFWTPLSMYEQVRPRGISIQRRGWGWLNATARLKTGVTLARASSEVTAQAKEMRARNFLDKDSGFRLEPAQAMPEQATCVVGSNYFSAMKIPLLLGREFDERDAQPNAAPVIIINETMARRFWPGKNPVGEIIQMLGQPWIPLQIIGVARDIKYYALGEAPMPYLYGSASQQPLSNATFQVRMRDGAVSPQLIATVAARVVPGVAVSEAITFAELRRIALFPQRAIASVTGLFGTLALALTAIGIYGIVSYTVNLRTREMGVRLALGAERQDIYRLVFGHELKVMAIGVALGVLAAGAARHARGSNGGAEARVKGTPAQKRWLASGGRKASNSPRRVLMSSFLQDLRYALRALRKQPGFTLLAALTLALGIGANGAIFSLSNALLLRPIAAPHPEELVRLYEALPEGRRGASHSYPDYVDYRDQNQTLAGLAAESNEGLVMSSAGQTEQLVSGVVSGNYFEVMQLRPALGRFFHPDEDQPGAGRVVVLGHRFWERRFGGEPEIVGSTVVLNNENFTVIGIAPKEFSADFAGLFLDVFVPVRQASHWIGTNWMQDREAARISIIGRRKPGVSLEQARADLNAVAGRLALAYPQTNKNTRLLVEQARFFDAGLRGPVMAFLGLMLAMAALVLLTACANLANFFLVKATARRREMAVRTALGATRGRLIGQVYVESMCVAALGGSLGLLVAAWLNGFLSNYNPFPPSIPVSIDLTPDYRVYLYSTLLTLLTGSFLAMAPARMATRTGVLGALKDEARGFAGEFSRTRGIFVAAQVALSLVLMIGAGLFLRSLQNVSHWSVGFEPSRLVAMDIDAGLKNWSEDRATQYYRGVVRRMESLSGIRSVTLANLMPLDVSTSRYGVVIPGQERPQGSDPLQVSFNRVGLRYFETLQIPLVSGRDFRGTDVSGSLGVVIVNQTMASRFWSGQDPVGQRFQLSRGKSGDVDTLAGGQWVTVIGVARDAKYRTLGEEPEAHMYLPYAQNFSAQRTLIVRTEGEPGSMIHAVQNELRLVDSDLVGFFARTGEQHLVLAYLPARLAATLSSLFGMLALALATLGLYGVVAWSVVQRTREIGVRMALGATRGEVVRMMMARGMRTVAAGIGIGLACALALSRFLASLLYGVSATDPVVFIAISVFLAALAAVASYWPARRAAQMDPVRALRFE